MNCDEFIEWVHDKFHKRLLKTKNSINKTSYKKHDIAFSHKQNINQYGRRQGNSNFQEAL